MILDEQIWAITLLELQHCGNAGEAVTVGPIERLNAMSDDVFVCRG
ncbi:hypothetical protein [Sphingomonas sp. S6]|jgi:hypothetical protein